MVVKQEDKSIDHSFDDLEKYARIEGIVAEHEEMMGDEFLEYDDDDYVE